MPTTIMDGEFTRLPSTNEWKGRLTKARDRSVESIIEFGREVYAFKLECEGVSGGSVFSQRMEEWLGFCHQHASNWAKIGEGKDELASRACKLPPSMTTMIDILQLPKDVRETAFDDGTITSDVTRAEVRALKPKADAEVLPRLSVEEQPEKWAASLQKKHGDRVGELVRAMIEELPESDIVTICKGQV